MKSVKPGARLLLAFSGGPDSTAALVSLAGERRNFSFTLYALHVNHNLRGAESEVCALAAAALCEKLKVPCISHSIKAGRIEALARRRGCGIEAAARSLRYKILREEARRLDADKIITAHNRDEFLETVLMRVLRGAGPAGLAGIKSGRVNLARPFLGVSKSEILLYLKNAGVPYSVDSSNKSPRYLRNKIRLLLVPALGAEFPFWERNLLAFSRTQSDVAAYLKKRASRVIKKNGVVRASSVRIAGFDKLPGILKEEVVFKALSLLSKNARFDFGADSVSGAGVPPPRRAALRALLSRKPRRGDLGGAVVLEFSGGDVVVSLKDRESYGRVMLGDE